MLVYGTPGRGAGAGAAGGVLVPGLPQTTHRRTGTGAARLTGSEMNFNIDYIGFAAATLTTCSFVPQVAMVWRQRGAPGISTGMYLTFIAGVALWFAYGVALKAWPIVIANGVTLLLAMSIVCMKWYFESRK
jgi:MtN3 and saliva related transmembrane protein